MSKIKTKLAGASRVELAAYWVGRSLCVLFARGYLRAGVTGLEHVPANGAFILSAVHRSNVDTPIVAILTKRRLRYMGKDSLWKNPVLAWVLSSLGGFPVSRGTADREALKRCIEVLEGGEPLVLFPEGERKTGDVVQPLFDGAAYVASRAGVPIVPVGMAGTEAVMPKGSKMVYPRKVQLVIGPPITVSVSASGKVPRSAVKQATEELHATLQVLYDDAVARLAAD